jgi:iron-sulfur cluster repair protein YtfE (RIC family)
VNALELMKRDHDNLKTMFDEALANQEPAARAGLLHQIRAELMAHERMEADVFYAALRSGGAKAREIVLDGLEEHHVIDVILDELREVPEEADHWQAKLMVLKENLEQHIRKEEDHVFPRAKAALDAATLDVIGRKMQQVKTAALA